MPLFDEVQYFISESLHEDTRAQLSAILNHNGAREVSISSATHVISNTIEIEGASEVQRDAAYVTPYWVERSMELGTLQDPKFYSADKDMFFSGVVATSADLPIGDMEMIAGGLIERGGAWREGLTRDVTHLFVTNTASEKYKVAYHFREKARIKIVLPHWFDQCFSMQMLLPTEIFEFPDPLYMRRDYDPAAYKTQLPFKVSRGTNGDYLEDGFNKSIMMKTLDTASNAPTSTRDIWKGRRILLTQSLELDSDRRSALEERIKRTGGSVVKVTVDQHEADVVEIADILITRYREGPAYGKAMVKGITIGTLAWFFYVEKTGIISRPKDQLLHYPVRSKPIPGFAGHVITVTNYQGEERDYLKKLIELMGATFTPSMSGKNTVVVAAYKKGHKAAKAEEWSLPIVNHKWLEDCFIEWRNLTHAQKKYLDYSANMDYGTLVGERGVGHVGLDDDPDFLSEPKNGSASKPESGQPAGNKKEGAKGGSSQELARTTNSVGDALEVKEVEVVLEVGGDDRRSEAQVSGAPVSLKKIGPPRGLKKAPTKQGTAVESTASKPHSKIVIPASEPTLRPKSKTNRVPTTFDIDGPATASASKNEAPVVPKTQVLSKYSPQPSENEAPMNDALPKSIPPVTVNLRSQLAAIPKAASDDSSIQEIPSPPVQAAAKPGSTLNKLKPIAIHNATKASTESSDDNPPAVSRPIRSKPGQAEEKIIERNVGGEEEDEEEAEHKQGQNRRKAKPKPKLSGPFNLYSDEENEVKGSSQMSLQGVKKLSPKTYKAKSAMKAKVRPPTSMSESSESDSDDLELFPKAKNVPSKKFSVKSSDKIEAKDKITPQPSPNRIVSVELPNARSLLTTLPSRTIADSPHAKAKPRSIRSTPIRVSAQEASLASPKRVSPLKRVSTSPLKPAECLPSRSSPCGPGAKSSSVKGSRPGVRRATSPSSEAMSVTTMLQRTPSRRSAAHAATQKLHDVMPDVITFEAELKRSKNGRRKSAGIGSKSECNDIDDDIKTDVRPVKKRKTRAIDDRAQSSSRLGTEASEDGPPGSLIPHHKGSKRSAYDGEQADAAGGPLKKVRLGKKDPETRSTSLAVTHKLSSFDPKKIRILKTKIEVPETIEKALVQLGVKFTQKPHQCTHLVTNGLARTEKFLCALSQAPFVLNGEWLTACASAKQILAEEDYFLHDPEVELKHNFKLSEALQRATELKKQKKQLLKGHFFYFTPNVPIDHKMLKNVLQSLGAEGKEMTPTLRNISDTRHVISSVKDENLWRPLANNGVTIYSHELVLAAAFTQFVDWKGGDKILS